MERFLIRNTPAIVYVLLQWSWVAARVGLRVLAFIAVRASLALLTGRELPSSTRMAGTRGLALAIGALWALTIPAATGLLTRSLEGGGVGLLLSLPLAFLVTRYVERWLVAHASAQRPGSVVLGTTQVSARSLVVSRPYTLSQTERFKTVAVNGPPGTGKSTWITNAVVADLHKGVGLAVIDPKDDLVDLILPHIPSEREQDVILFDATDVEWPLGFNPLAGVAPERRSLAASELLAVFRRYFAPAWGARMEHILTNTILALFEVPGATLLDLPRFLLDAERRQHIVGGLSNIGVQQFFQVEYDQILRGRGEALEPILNKVGPWLTFPELRNIFGQRTSSFEPRSLMDDGKILLARLPQGVLGTEISALLASLLVAKIQLAAHSRVDTPADRRRPFILYLDEAHNYANSSLERILVESRAFKLGLVVANQYPEQLSRELQVAIERNATATVQCLYQRGQHLLQVTRLEDLGQQVAPRVLSPFPPLPPGDPRRTAALRELSRQHYGRPRAEVEAEIIGKLQMGSPPGPRMRAKPAPARSKRSDLDEE